MADVSKIKLLDNSEYNIKDAFKSGIYVVKGTQTASTGTWTGALHGVSALYDGLTIMYYLPWAGSGNATLNLTLDDGTTTGAINCYYGNTTRLTTHYGKGNNIVMTYWSAGSISIDGTATTDNRWIANADYAVNDTAYYIRRSQTDILAGPNKILPYTIVMENADSRWESIVTSSTTASTKTRNSHGFRLGNILFMYVNATYNENVRVANNNLWEMHTGTPDARYTFNVENNATKGLLANKPIYLVGSLNDDGLFYLDATWWTQTLPSTEDGKLYIHIGDAYDYYRFSFLLHRPIYHYVNGAIREFIQDAGTVNGHAVATDVPADAVFTDTKNTAGSTNTSSKIFLIGATSQATNPQTYSHDTAYVGTDGCLYSGGTKVLTAHQDISGKVSKSGDTMTGNLTMRMDSEKTASTNPDTPAQIALQTRWTDQTATTPAQKTSTSYIRAYSDHSGYGNNVVINPGGNLFLGGGEAPQNHYALYENNGQEKTYLTGDTDVHIQGNGNTIANRKGLLLNTNHELLPEVADVATNNVGSIGNSTTKWANGYFTNINGVAVGSSPKFTDTTYESKQETQGGTDLSLVTTGEKYTWNHATGTDTIPSGYCDTAGGTAAKVVQLTGYTNTANQVFMLTLVNANTYAGEITLNVNSTGAKTLYINGQASSSSNYTLPAGSYLVSTSSGDKYSVRTDGKQPVNISGSANTVNGYTVEKNVPSNAEFTDTTYESLPEASSGTDLSLVTTGDKWNWNRTFPFKPGLEVASLDDLVGLMDYSTDKRCFSGVIKITTNIGIGVTGWRRIIAIAQNAVNNGTYDIGMFCMFFPAGSSEFVNYALIDGKTTGNYSVSKTGQFVTNVFASTVQITTAGNGQLNLGNNLASGATGKSRGRLVIFSNTDTHYSDIRATGLSDNRNLFCPDKSGTIALEADLYKYLDIEKETTTGATVYPISSLALADGLTSGYVGGIRIQLMPATSILQLLGTNGTTVGAELSSGYLKLYGNNGGIDNATAQRLRLMASNESNYYVDLGTKESTPAWCFAPAVTKKLRLGSPSYLWTTVYAQSGSINTSDRNEKKDIVPLDESAKDFIMALNPVSYKFKDGESGRTHYGMIAQDVEQEMSELGMTAMDFAGFCKDQKTIPYETEENGQTVQKDMPVEGQYTYGLRYEEFMAPAIKTIQLLQNQVDTQQQEIDELKQQLAEIKAMLNGGN